MDDEHYFDLAAEQAKKSLCLDKKCGAVVVKDGQVIGVGYNAPPEDDVARRRCHIKMDKTKKYPSDKSCCVHAEQRAIYNALITAPKNLKGASLYYVTVDEKGRKNFSGWPWCTHCSKLALDAGISKFYLYHKDGAVGYDTKEYNDLSYASSDSEAV